MTRHGRCEPGVLTVRLTPGEAAVVRAVARLHGRTVNALLRELAVERCTEILTALAGEEESAQAG